MKFVISIGFATIMLAGIAGATAQAGSFYDSRGNKVGSSTTSSGATNYYNSRGNRVGTSYR
jgi:hypothetical protein